MDSYIKTNFSCDKVPCISESLKNMFRKGFYPKRLATWRIRIIKENNRDYKNEPVISLSNILELLNIGKRAFGYGGHDKCVYKMLKQNVDKYNLKFSADIGCESGVFPAMHIHAGIKKVVIYEIRPIRIDHPACEVRLKNLLEGCENEPQYDLITCLSTIEHVGLGRYGDYLDPSGDIKLAEILRSMVKPGGMLILSFPVGKGCVVYNEARIYTPFRMRQLFGEFKLLKVGIDISWRGILTCFNSYLFPGHCGCQPVFLLRKSLF